ncbi:MAG: MFS transporter [Anaerolineae bacterium]
MTEATIAQPVFSSAAEESAYKRRWLALIILSLSLTLIVVDSTIVNIAFPTIRATFGASYADAEWVNSIYSLVFGAALITWGKLGDQFGRRNIFIAGALTFVIASAGVGFADSIGVVVLFRALQGMGGAMMSPSTLSIISSTFKGRERGIAFGMWGATAGIAAVLGPILGGWLIEYGTGITEQPWRLAFLINIPIGLIAIGGSFYAIREVIDRRIKHSIDWLGIILASLALGGFVFGAIEGQNYGWLEAKKVFTLGPITYPTLAEGASITPGTPSFIPFMFLFGAVMLALTILLEVRWNAVVWRTVV